MATTRQKISRFKSQLLPTGRAWWLPKNGWMLTLNNALSLSAARLWDDIQSTIDSALPDNSNFTADDATDWERRLGIIQTSADLEDRKLAIKRKMAHPGLIPARQNYLYVQGQLRAAGFDVYVFENRFDDGAGGLETRSPQVVSGGGATDVNHGEYNHGQVNHGAIWANKVVNSINEDRDATFNVGDNLRSTFFIGGDPVGSYAYVPVERKLEFRQLILKLKPVQSVAYLFIVYT